MDRSTSTENPPYYGGTYAWPRPPWENRDLPTVPFIASPRLNAGEREGTSSPWTRQPSNAGSGHRPKLSTDTKATATADAAYISPSSPEERTNPWWETPRHVPQQPQQHESPYETPVYAPNGQKGYRPPLIPDRAPPTPPESVSSARPSPPAYPAAPPMALPGTMSSREQSRSRTRSSRRGRSGSQRQNRQNEAQPRTEPLGRRVRAALTNMFKKDPIDENDFERIHSKHWTEEDY